MATRVILRRVAAGCALAAALAATSVSAAERVTGPDPALAPGQDQRPAGVTTPSTVYHDAEGKPYVLRGREERQYLSGFNVTWIDKNHVIGPLGFGGFD